MRRVFAMVATTALLLSTGCGVKVYEERLNRTLEEMKYRKRLDDRLMPASTKGKMEQLLIYLRPPKTLQGPGKEFQLAVIEPGKFDVTESYYEPEKQSLHVLARVKRPKGPDSKKAAANPAETATRGEFNADVIAVLNSVYSLDIDLAKAKEEPKRRNKFKRLAFEANGKNVEVFLYGSKTSPYEVALVFEYAKAEKAGLASKIDLALGSFAVGETARRMFSGALSDEEAADGGAVAPGGPSPF